jgi:ribonuclease HII
MLLPYYQSSITEAGVDEAGRGCFAGPVVAAAVILPPDFDHPLLNDSKQVREADRDSLRSLIEAEAIAWGVGMVSVAEIDEINILQATFKAMRLAIDQLAVRPETLLIDGNRFPGHPSIPHFCMIGGDARFRSIAAASILAKTIRDEYMRSLHDHFPMYGWLQNKGYGTAKHRAAIATHGITVHHRKSFRILPDPTLAF